MSIKHSHIRLFGSIDLDKCQCQQKLPSLMIYMGVFYCLFVLLRLFIFKVRDTFVSFDKGRIKTWLFVVVEFIKMLKYKSVGIIIIILTKI